MFAAMQSNMLHWMATDLRICHNHSKPLLRWWHPNKCTETSISLINLGCSHNYLSYKPQTHNGVLTYINILLILFNYLGRLVNWVFFGFWHTSTSCIISLFFRESWISGAPKSCRVGISPEIDWNEKKRDDSSRGQIFGFDFQCMYGIGSKRCLVFHKGLQASAPYKPKKSWFVWCTGSQTLIKHKDSVWWVVIQLTNNSWFGRVHGTSFHIGTNQALAVHAGSLQRSFCFLYISSEASNILWLHSWWSGS